MNEKVERQFKGLWIPNEVLEMDLSPTAKLLWADIHSFTGRDASFFKSNERIAQEYRCSERTISRAITTLKVAGLIEVSTDGRLRKCRSRVDNLSMQGRQNVEAESTKCLHSKQESKQVRKQVSRAKPKKEEVQLYFASQAADVREADKFFDYYETNGWKQGRGKSIKDWKAAARNWIRNAEQWNKKPRGFHAGNFTTDGAIDFVDNG